MVFARKQGFFFFEEYKIFHYPPKLSIRMYTLLELIIYENVFDSNS